MRVKDLQVFELKFLDDDLGNFSTTSFSCKIGFNSISYSKLVSEMRDVCHCLTRKLSLHPKTVLSQIIFCFTRKNLLPTQFCVYCFTGPFLSVFNITLKYCLWYLKTLDAL